jgi:hypothetical protein
MQSVSIDQGSLFGAVQAIFSSSLRAEDRPSRPNGPKSLN